MGRKVAEQKSKKNELTGTPGDRSGHPLVIFSGVIWCPQPLYKGYFDENTEPNNSQKIVKSNPMSLLKGQLRGITLLFLWTLVRCSASRRDNFDTFESIWRLLRNPCCWPPYGDGLARNGFPTPFMAKIICLRWVSRPHLGNFLNEVGKPFQANDFSGQSETKWLILPKNGRRCSDVFRVDG